MHWLIGAAALIVIAILLRRSLFSAAQARRGAALMSEMKGEREPVYRPVAHEVESRAAILAVSLNGAMDESQAGREETAWQLMELALREWLNLEKLNGGLHNLMERYFPVVESVVPLRRLDQKSFRAPEMSNYARWHDVLDQFVFPSRLRFQLHLQVLRQAAEALVADLHLPLQATESRSSSFEDTWKLCERDFHDYDLVIKETLVGFRAFLSGLSPQEVPAFAADLEAFIRLSSHSLPANIQSTTPTRS